MSHQERYADTGTTMHELATHYIVHCPKCEGRANVMPYKKTWRLNCTKCFHVEEKGHWYGAMTAYASVKCRECNERITRHADVDGRFTTLMLTCQNCGDEHLYDAHVSTYPIHHGLMCDNIFGLPLWLQQRMGDDLFWAYNFEQLDMVEQIVAAKLRERGLSPKATIKKNSSMMSRLPEFIKKAKNRKDVLKVINDLRLKTV